MRLVAYGCTPTISLFRRSTGGREIVKFLKFRPIGTKICLARLRKKLCRPYNDIDFFEIYIKFAVGNSYSYLVRAPSPGAFLHMHKAHGLGAPPQNNLLNAGPAQKSKNIGLCR